VEPVELGKIAPDLFDAARRLRPGQVDRRDQWWDKRLGLNGFEAIGKRPNWFLHEGPDGPDGLLAWRVDRDFTLTGELASLDVVEFVAANDIAYRDMWAYLGGIDVVSEIKLTDRPVDEPVRWLLPDGRALQTRTVFDYLWLRLLDVPAALSARSYAAPGRVVFDVRDADVGGFGTGTFLLESDGDQATCTPTGAAADLVLTQRALAACYLGGSRLRAVPGVEELTPGALTRADLMFSVPLAPVNQTGF
jgi:predicted acetyltransferase